MTGKAPTTRRSLIIGASGQDGTYLRELLRSRGEEVWNLSTAGLWLEGSDPQPLSCLDLPALTRFIREHPPQTLYYLAAYHHASQDRSVASEEDLWSRSMQVNVQGWVNCLLAIHDRAPHCHAVYAASSHVFGRAKESPQTERTPFDPVNVYGISKVAGLQAARFYRKVHGLRASSVILYNHESPRRSEKFVSQKIIRTLRKIRSGQEAQLVLGDLSAIVDWGYAPDYVEAMRRIAELPSGEDFIVATGEARSVRDFVSVACDILGLEVEKVVCEDRTLLGPGYSPVVLVGDATKLRAATGWAPTISFAEMVRTLVDAAA